MTEATTNDDGVFVDDHNYPTAWGIAQLRAFTGSPAQLIDLLHRMWWTPTLIITATICGDREPIREVRMATGGWSGNEELVNELDNTYFALRYWQSSHRGGLHIYHVPAAHWDVDTDLIGALPRPPAPE